MKKEKNTGEEGRLYELELLVLFFQRAYHLHMDFHLGREVKAAGKFDDLVFRYKKKDESYSRYMQAKHCIHEDTKITSNVLFPSKCDKRIKNNLADKFHLDKYLTSFMAIKNHHRNEKIGQLKDLVIFTNVDFDYQELKNKGIDPSFVTDDFIDFSTPEKKGKLVRLNIDPNSQFSSVLKNCSDYFMLATELILQVKEASENPKTRNHYLGITDSMSAKYAKALLTEVIEISENEITFQEQFLHDNSEISEKARIFRGKLLDIAREQYHYTEDAFLDKARSSKLVVVTKTFQRGEHRDLPTEEITSKDLEEFFEVLVFAVNQPNADQLMDLIADQELKKSFGYINTDFIAESLKNKILNWINEKKSKEGWIDSTDAEKFFINAKKMISSLTVSVLCKPYVNSLLSVKTVGRIFNNVTEFLKGYEHFNKQCLVIKSSGTFVTSSRLYGIVKNLSQALFMNSLMLRRREDQQVLLEALKCTDCNLLVIEHSEDFNFDINMVNQLLDATIEAEKKLIFVVPHDSHLFPEFQSTLEGITDEDVSFEDLSPESQARVLDNEVEFQGYPVKIEDLFDVEESADDIASIINSRTIARLIRDQEKVKIGKPIHTEKFEEIFYIERVLLHHRVLVRKIPKDKLELDWSPPQGYLCKEFIDNTFIISEVLKKFFLKRVGEEELEITEETDFVDKVPEELLLHYNNKKRLIIISDTAGMGKSTVMTSLSNRFKQKYPLKWVKRINLNDHTSTLAKYKRNKIESREEAIHFFCQVFLQNNKDDEEIKEELVYKYYSKNKEKDMVILLDGLDEICPDYKEAVIQLIKVLFEETKIGKLVVSTRPNMKTDLEHSLKVSAYSMEQFSVEQQVRFLIEFWCKRNPRKLIDKSKVRRFAERLIHLLNHCIKDNERKLTGIPLLTKMVATVFEKRRGKAEVSDYEDYNSYDSKDDEQTGCSLEEYYCSGDSEPSILENIDLGQLYKQFVRIKYWDILETQKRLTDCTKPDVQDRVQTSYEQFLSDYQLLSLSTILPEKYNSLLDTSQKQKIENLVSAIITGKDKNGLINEIIDGKPNFFHRTFAEYFFVELATKHFHYLNDRGPSKERVHLINGDNYKKFDEFFFQEVLLKENYQTVRQFFDIKVGKVLSCIKKRHLNKDLLYKPVRDIHNSAVHAALANNHLNIVKFLDLCFGSNIKDVLEYKQSTGKDVIEIAVSKGNLAMVKWTINKGVKVRDKPNLLYLAIECENWEVADYLVNRYRQEHYFLFNEDLVGKRNRFGATLLLHASAFGSVKTVEMLLKLGADIEDQDIIGCTSLLRAAEAGRQDTFVCLVENGADLQKKDDDKTNVLHYASSGGNLEIVKYLTSEGFDIHEENFSGWQALHFASQKGKADVVQFLLEQGAVIHKKDRGGRTPLHIASHSGNVKTVENLLQYGAAVHDRDNSECTAILRAALGGKHDILVYLTKKGAQLRDMNFMNSNVLHFASYVGDLETAKYLLTRRFDIHEEDKRGSQAIHFAAHNGKADMVRFLLKWGANIHKKDNEGRTPSDLASKFGNRETVKILLQHGGILNTQAVDKGTFAFGLVIVAVIYAHAVVILPLLAILMIAVEEFIAYNNSSKNLGIGAPLLLVLPLLITVSWTRFYISLVNDNHKRLIQFYKINGLQRSS